jgi:hypothetical protein
MSQEEQHSVETNASVEGTKPSTLNDMFALLLNGIKTLKGAPPTRVVLYLVKSPKLNETKLQETPLTTNAG